jgi:hypothetical protein
MRNINTYGVRVVNKPGGKPAVRILVQLLELLHEHDGALILLLGSHVPRFSKQTDDKNVKATTSGTRGQCLPKGSRP